jgi:hypothetical protein
MLQDILYSCRDFEKNNELAERYPKMYEKDDAETLVKNLKNYIMNMNNDNKLGL